MAKPKTQILDEIGVSGLPMYAGRVFNEPLTKLSGDRWRKVVRDMQTNDSSINAMLFVIEMLARQVSWTVEAFETGNAKDEEIAEFYRGALFKDLSDTWQETLSEILSMIPWGWSYLEIVYLRRSGENDDAKLSSNFADGKIGWRKFALRSQETLFKWETDDNGNVTGLTQTAPPDFRQRTIPLIKALHFRTSSHKNNPEGKSILRGGYRDWYFKANIENIEGVGIERDLAGLPVMYVPAEILSPNANENDTSLRNELLKMLRGVKRDEQEGMLLPIAYDSKGNQLYKFELLSTGGKREFDTSKVIDRHDQRMMMSVMADFLLLGSKETGSYALSDNKSKLFCNALSAWLDSICDVFNRQAIPRLQKLNGWDTARMPKLTHGAVEQISLEALGTYLQHCSQSGIEFDEKQQNWITQQIGMPAKAATNTPKKETKPTKTVKKEKI